MQSIHIVVVSSLTLESPATEDSSNRLKNLDNSAKDIQLDLILIHHASKDYDDDKDTYEGGGEGGDCGGVVTKKALIFSKTLVWYWFKRA